MSGFSRTVGSLPYNLSAMATLHPFRALRPNAATASRIAAVPYDVVSTDEARALADGNPMSFLRVSRAEIELPAGSDPYADAVYQKAAGNFAALRTDASLFPRRPHDAFGSVRLQPDVQVRLKADTTYDAPVDWRGAIAGTYDAPVDWRGAIAGTYDAPVDWRGAIAGTYDAPVDWRGADRR